MFENDSTFRERSHCEQGQYGGIVAILLPCINDRLLSLMCFYSSFLKAKSPRQNWLKPWFLNRLEETITRNVIKKTICNNWYLIPVWTSANKFADLLQLKTVVWEKVGLLLYIGRMNPCLVGSSGMNERETFVICNQSKKSSALSCSLNSIRPLQCGVCAYLA